MARQAKKRSPKKALRRDRELWLYLLILLLCAAIVWVLTRPGEEAPAPAEDMFTRSAAFDPDQLVAALETKFGLPPGRLSPKKIRGETQIQVPVDRRKMDLTYANLIVKTEFESRGATLANGQAESGQHQLAFTHGSDEYLVKLSYAAAPIREGTAEKYLAIVVDDFGLVGGEMLQQWLELPTEIDFAIFAGQKHSEETMNRSFAQGRETLVHVPMEPIGYPQQNPGENSILVQMDQSEVEKTLLRHINALPLCAGVNNHMGSLATTDHDIMGWVMGVLKKKGKFFLDSRTSNVSIAYQAAQKARIPAYRNDLFLDSPDISEANLESRLRQVQELGTKNNTVIAITHCHSAQKLQYLKDFLKRIQAAGFTLIPLSQVGKTDLPLIL